MISPPSTTEIRLEALVLWAKTCDELKAEGPKGPSSTRAKSCRFCGQVVSLGPGNNDHALLEHIRSKKCRKSQHSQCAGWSAASTPGTLARASSIADSKTSHLPASINTECIDFSSFVKLEDTEEQCLQLECKSYNSAPQRMP
jgi:hypothetical protein